MAAVAEHLDKSIVTVQQSPIGSGEENAFLDLLKQEPVLFLGGAPVGRVPDNVNGSLLFAVLVGVGRSRNQRISAKTGIRTLNKVHIATRAIRTTFPLILSFGQNALAEIADHGCRR